MARRPDDHALLELIEHPLNAEDVSSRMAELDTGTRLALDQMRRDRSALTGLPEPALPRDFVAAMSELLEPVAPMVLGTGRRSGIHRLVSDWTGTRSFGRALAGLSMAACGGAAIATVIWITLGRGQPEGASGVPETRTIADAAPAPMRAPAAKVYPLDADVHHHAPVLRADTALAGASHSTRAPGAGAAGPAAASPTIDLAGGAVALVVRADKPGQGIDALRRAVEASSPQQAALVRNVTYTEAGDLEMRVRAAARAANESAPALASSDSSVGRAAHERPRVVVDPSLAQETLGEHLAGPRSVAATPDLQLLLSDDGFTHSITVPVERLRDLVMALAFDETVRMQIGRREALAPDAHGATRAPAPATNAWQRWKDATSMIGELERTLPKGTQVVVAARVQGAR